MRACSSSCLWVSARSAFLCDLRLANLRRFWPLLRCAFAGSLDAGPTGDLAFLVTEYGNPFSDKAFTGRMRSWTTAAGLQDRSSHGLRKLRGALLAEAGATEKEIAAALGHTDFEQVKTYTASVDNRRLVASAANKLATNSPTSRL